MNLIIFDIDETLTKSDEQHKTAYVKSMKEIGIIRINQNWKEYPHHTDSFILKTNYENNFNNEFDVGLINNFENLMTEIMQSLKPVKAMDGANKFITSLTKGEKYAFAFATGSLLQPALHKLRQAGIWHEKILIASSNNYYTREEIVTDAIERAKMYYNTTEFERIISIGDGIWDLKTAQNLGIHFIGVGQNNDQKFKHENVKVITENWENFDIENTITFL